MPAIALALLLLPPVAAAMPIRDRVGVPEPTPTPAPDVVMGHATDFAWIEALLGFGIATALCCLVFAALTRRRRAAGVPVGP